jgi:hypothetical protein
LETLLREWRGTSRSDAFTVVPLGDLHVGARACDEKRLQNVIKRIANDDKCYWVGLGDYVDAINVRDPRFAPDALAEWLSVRQLTDIAKAERDRLFSILDPIAGKCLGLIEGNHEAMVKKWFERDIYSEIVSHIKEVGKFKPDHNLAFGYSGWMQLRFAGKGKSRGEPMDGNTRTFNFFLHHGFTGGKLKGSKGLEMERWLWTHNADVVIFGHSHNADIMTAAVEAIDKAGNVHVNTRYGCFAGTFLASTVKHATTYSEMKGYYPLPIAGCEIRLLPRSENREDSLRVAIG